MAEAKADAVVEQQLEESQESVEGQIEENQENEVDVQAEGSPLEDEVKKWQSMYDKASADNAKLQSSITEYLSAQQAAQQQQNIKETPSLTEDEFNPWDAYYKPNSPSYQMRVQHESSLVHSVLDKEIQRVENNMAVNNTRSELRRDHNMTDADINEFMDFVSKPKDSVPVSSLVKLWKDSSGRSGQIQNVTIPRTKQQAPRTAGTQNNQSGKVRKSEESKIWDNVLNSTGVTNRIP